MTLPTESIEIKDSKQAESIISGLDKKGKKLLLEALNKDKETLEGLPELANKNFRVKDTKNRREIIDLNGVKVLENPEGDVREYLEGQHKGEQLFTQDSALRETNNAGKILPASWTVYRDIIEKKYKGDYQDFLMKEKISFPGFHSPGYGTFGNIDKGFNLRCADGSNFNGSRDKPYNSKGNKDYGFSIRCLKD